MDPLINNTVNPINSLIQVEVVSRINVLNPLIQVYVIPSRVLEEFLCLKYNKISYIFWTRIKKCYPVLKRFCDKSTHF